MNNRIVDLIVTIIGIATVTTLVLPNRPTPAIISTLGTTFSKATSAAMGR